MTEPIMLNLPLHLTFSLMFFESIIQILLFIHHFEQDSQCTQDKKARIQLNLIQVLSVSSSIFCEAFALSFFYF